MGEVSFLVAERADLGLVFIYPHVDKDEIPSVTDGYLVVNKRDGNIINMLIDIDGVAMSPVRARRIAQAFELAADMLEKT
jgi:hypothetical protein